MGKTYCIFLSSMIALALCPVALASDAKPLQDFCVADPSSSVYVNGFACKDPKLVQADDFFFTGMLTPRNTSNLFGSNVTRVSVLEFPGLNTLGISMARIDYEPSGINPPHSHPRASEFLTVLEGTLRVGFVTPIPPRFFTKVLNQGDAFVFPMGMVHFQRNVGSGNAVALSALNSQNPGILNMPRALFASNPPIPSEDLAKAFLMDEEVVEHIKSMFFNH